MPYRFVDLNRAILPPLLALAAMLGVACYAFAPGATEGWRVLQAGDDPVALADLRLETTLTPSRFSQKIEGALAAGDDELAESFVDLGQPMGLAPTEQQQVQLAELRRHAAKRTAQEFAEGFRSGLAESGAGIAGALAGDLTGYGDARDLWHETGRMARGEEADNVVIGVAAVGLVMSAATWGSLGAALPARSGLTLVKTAQKAGRLSKPLVASVSAATAKAIDRDALAASFKAAQRLDIPAARQATAKALRADALIAFKALGEDAALLYRSLGARGAKQVFAIAGDPAELRVAARLAAARGGKTRAILATLGRGALAAGVAITVAFQAVASFLVCLFALAICARALGVSLGRLRFRKKIPQPPQGI